MRLPRRGGRTLRPLRAATTTEKNEHSVAARAHSVERPRVSPPATRGKSSCLFCTRGRAPGVARERGPSSRERKRPPSARRRPTKTPLRAKQLGPADQRTQRREANREAGAFRPTLDGGGSPLGRRRRLLPWMRQPSSPTTPPGSAGCPAGPPARPCRTKHSLVRPFRGSRSARECGTLHTLTVFSSIEHQYVSQCYVECCV